MTKKLNNEAFSAALCDGRVWIAAARLTRDLLINEPHVAEDYADTKGKTDWVWVEEGIETELDAAGMSPDSSREVYVATFALVLGALRARWPQIAPPKWFVKETASFT